MKYALAFWACVAVIVQVPLGPRASPYSWKSRHSGLGFIPERSMSDAFGSYKNSLVRFNGNPYIFKRDRAYAEPSRQQLLRQRGVADNPGAKKEDSLSENEVAHGLGDINPIMSIPSFIRIRFKEYEKCLEQDEIDILKNVYSLVLRSHSVKDLIQPGQGKFVFSSDPDYDTTKTGSGDMSVATTGGSRKWFLDKATRSKRDVSLVENVVESSKESPDTFTARITDGGTLLKKLLDEQTKQNLGPTTFDNYKQYGVQTSTCKKAMFQARLCSAG